MADSCRFDFGDLREILDALGDRSNQVVQQQGPVIAEILVSYVLHEFETEGRGRWPPLADSTKLQRR